MNAKIKIIDYGDLSQEEREGIDSQIEIFSLCEEMSGFIYTILTELSKVHYINLEVI